MMHTATSAEQIECYTVDRKLTEGGMAEAFLAHRAGTTGRPSSRTFRRCRARSIAFLNLAKQVNDDASAIDSRQDSLFGHHQGC